MTHRDSRPHPFLCLLLALAAGCDAPDPSDREPVGQQPPSTTAIDTTPVDAPVPASVDELVERGLLLPGETRSEIAEALGPPDSVASRAVPNRHMPGVVDTLFTLVYPGLVADVHRPGGGGDLLSTVEVTENRYLRFPGIGIGVARERLEEVLGTPDERGAATYTYHCRRCAANESVIYTFADGRVTRIRFDYYVD